MPPSPGPRPAGHHPTARERLTHVARRCSALVLSEYSTSFSRAGRLFDPRTRPHVAAVYAWARVADEIVDGAFHDPAAVDDDATVREEARALLHEYRERTDRARRRGFDPDPVVHAFADTARRFGYTDEHVRPFFESMETDLDVRVHTPESLAAYVHGSAEVIGEMCLLAFDGGSMAGDPDAAAGARALGSAFQKVNFLRDVRHDFHDLGRDYLPGHDPAALTDADVTALADEVDAELRVARATIERIPGRDGAAVLAAHDLFAELNRRLRAAGAAGVSAGRVRVPDPVKALVVARAVATARGGTR